MIVNHKCRFCEKPIRLEIPSFAHLGNCDLQPVFVRIVPMVSCDRCCEHLWGLEKIKRRLSLVLFHFRLAKIPDVRSKLSISIKGYIKTFIGKLSDFYAIDFDCSDALYDEIMANPTKAVDYLDYAIKNYGKMALR